MLKPNTVPMQQINMSYILQYLLICLVEGMDIKIYFYKNIKPINLSPNHTA